MGIEIMSYHRMAIGEVESPHRAHALEDLEVPGEEQVEAIRDAIREHRVACRISK